MSSESQMLSSDEAFPDVRHEVAHSAAGEGNLSRFAHRVCRFACGRVRYPQFSVVSVSLPLVGKMRAGKKRHNESTRCRMQSTGAGTGTEGRAVIGIVLHELPD